MPDLHDDVLLYSGGLDSLIAWEFLGRPMRLYCSLGHAYESEERGTNWDADVELGPNVAPVVEDSSYHLSSWEQGDAKIPARNMLLGIAGARHARHRVWLVAQQGEMKVPDKTPFFFAEASAMLTRLFERPLQFNTPFADKDKTEMVAWFVEAGHDPQRLVRSWSCYHPAPAKDAPTTKECGNCPACLRKYIALVLNDIDTAGHWAEWPGGSEAAREYVRRAHAGDFDPKRAERTLTALE